MVKNTRPITCPKTRNNLLNTKYCDDKLAQLKREQAIVQTARNAYANALQGELPKES